MSLMQIATVPRGFLVEYLILTCARILLCRLCWLLFGTFRKDRSISRQWQDLRGCRIVIFVKADDVAWSRVPSKCQKGGLVWVVCFLQLVSRWSLSQQSERSEYYYLIGSRPTVDLVKNYLPESSVVGRKHLFPISLRVPVRWLWVSWKCNWGRMSWYGFE